MQVVEGNTGHLESVQVIYDPAKVSYETLLWTFWHKHRPLPGRRQACDTGPNYHTAVFVRGPRAAQGCQRVAPTDHGPFPPRGGGPGPHAGQFYPAEEYHQDYARKNPVRYGNVRTGCGRDRRLREILGR